MARSTINLDDLFASLTPRRLTGTLDRGDAYAALLHLLDDARSGQDRTTAAGLWTVLQTIPNLQVFGGRDRLHQLLRTAEDDGQIRRTTAGRILLRLDAPASGGPEHVWVRLECRGGSEVEVTGANPWPTPSAVPSGASPPASPDARERQMNGDHLTALCSTRVCLAQNYTVRTTAAFFAHGLKSRSWP